MTDEEIKGILFPMELAEISDEIVPWVDLMRRKLGGKVHILHVIPKIDYLHVHYALDPSRFDDVDAITERTKEKIKKFSKERLGEESEPQITVLLGYPAEEIIKYVKSNDISMIVMGTHGKSGLERAVFGSVADKVLRLSPVPIFVCQPKPRRSVMKN
jgi:nucleotide-binding universal stress UspA family protein